MLNVIVNPDKFGHPDVFATLDHLVEGDAVYVSSDSSSWGTVSLLIAAVTRITPHRVHVMVGAAMYEYERSTGRARGNAPRIYPVSEPNRLNSDLILRERYIKDIQSDIQRGFGYRFRSTPVSPEQCLAVAEILGIKCPTTRGNL